MTAMTTLLFIRIAIHRNILICQVDIGFDPSNGKARGFTGENLSFSRYSQAVTTLSIHLTPQRSARAAEFIEVGSTQML